MFTRLRTTAQLLALVVLIPCASRAQQAGIDPQMIHAQWNSLLAKYVAPTGRVNYPGLVADRARLASYLQLIRKTSPDTQAGWTENDKKAFWINVYNAATVQLIVQHYPVGSMKDIRLNSFLGAPKSPWEKNLVLVGGLSYSLNEIEKTVLHKRYKDPRVHFALVCAAVSAPGLLAEAYTGARLPQQLEAQAAHFINDPLKNRVAAGKAELSGVFDWYARDFGGNDQATLAYVNRYARVRVAPGTKPSILPYDWSLNEQTEPARPATAAGPK